MPTTIRDIAREAGVSTATVSKVINNKMYVAPATREKVLQIMKDLNYSPNVSASNLARKATKTVFYADSFHKGLPYQNPHMFDIICGVSYELGRKGYQLSLFNLSSSPKQVVSDLEEMISAKAADGIIINSSFITPKLERLILQYDFPQICIGEPAFDSILSWIDTNNSLSANLAVEHLLQCGCRRLAFMGGQESDKIFMDRLKGFKIALRKNGLELLDGYITYNEPDVNAIFQSALRLLELPTPPDGIVCTNSLMTVGTMRAIKEKEISVPDELSLIAFDDYPYSSIITPAPTVIDIDLFSLGVNAGSLLVRKIKDPAMLVQTYTALPHLIQRETTRMK